ncbi:MAG TPA: 2Fe-2S iron-sulfur cluster-binding protein [Candidatus Limnocylindrales bacterium]|nr:2Fe-2S iron-sulfur cluster-binding protein [Candidatus Limnocylindrales bacterium]
MGGLTAAAVEVRVARSDPDAPRTFSVERGGSRVVLDLLIAIQRQLDPTLGFRYSCRVATCGTCTVRVDGLPVLACQAIVPDTVRHVRIEPLAGLPVVRDLIVDMRPFLERWAAVEPFEPGSPVGEGTFAVVSPESPERRAIDPTLDCISCGACFSACGVAGDGRRFLGPAALNRAMTLVGDSRDADGGHARSAFGPGGIDDCHSIGACTVVCPKGLDPAGAIRRLRRWRIVGHA